ncbi:hypothetical protein C0J52_07455 [Blattella germanica]|nr:hypothetical protein C0J52_07455 [Blattella germanica]
MKQIVNHKFFVALVSNRVAMSKKKQKNVKEDATLNVVSFIPVPQYKSRDNNLVDFLTAQKKDFEDDENSHDETTLLRNENRKRTDDMIQLFVTPKQDLTLYNGLGNEQELLERAIAESLKCHQDETTRFAELDKKYKLQEEILRVDKVIPEEHTFSNVVPEFEDWDSDKDSTIIKKTENEKWDNFSKYVDERSKHGDPMKTSTVYFNDRVATHRTSFTMDEDKNDSDIPREDRHVDSNSNTKHFTMNKTSDWKSSAFREKRREDTGFEDWESEGDEPTGKVLEFETKSKPLLHTTTKDRRTFSENRSSGRQTFAENRSSGRQTFPENRSSGRQTFAENRSSGRQKFPENRTSGRQKFPENRTSGRQTFPENRTSHRKSFSERSSDKRVSGEEDWDENDDDSTVYGAKTSDFELKYKNVYSTSTSRRETFPDNLMRNDKVSAFQETHEKNIECENWEPSGYSLKKSTPDLELNYKNRSSKSKRVDWDDSQIKFNQESRNERTLDNNIKSNAQESHVNDSKYLNKVVSNSGWNTTDNREGDLSKKLQTNIASSCGTVNDDGNVASNDTRFTYEVPSKIGETLRDSSSSKNFVPSMINGPNEIEQVPVPSNQNLFKEVDDIYRKEMQRQLLTNYNPSPCQQSDSMSTHSLTKTVNEIEASLFGTQVQNSSDQVPKSLNATGNQTRPTSLDIHNNSSSDFIFSQTRETLPSSQLRQISQAELINKMNLLQANQPMHLRQVSAEEIQTKMNIPQSLPMKDELLSKMNNAQANPSVPATQISGVSPEEMFLKMNAFNFPFMQSYAQNEMMARMNPLASQSPGMLPPGIAANPLFMNMNRVSPPNQVHTAPNYANLPETASTGMAVGLNNMPEVLQTSQPTKPLPDAALPMKPVLNVPENPMQRLLLTPHVPGPIGSGLPNPTVDINSVSTNKTHQALPNTQTLSNSTSALNSVPENQGQQQPVPQTFAPAGPEAQGVPPFMMPNLAASMMYNNYWLQASMLNPYMTNFYPQMAGINPANVHALAMNMQNNNSKMSVPTSSAPGNLQSPNVPGNLLGNTALPMSASSVPHMAMMGAPQHNMAGVSGQTPASQLSFIQSLSQLSQNPGILANSGLAPAPAKGRGRLRH